MNKLIINADDFGLNLEVNDAIMAAMNLNLCMDTTLLVNFEKSAHAADLAIRNDKINNVGIHLNLTEGHPLTGKILNESRFCNREGLFHYKKKERIVSLTKFERIAVYEELISQIDLCRDLGIPISHADSNNHIHEEPGLFLLIIEILKKKNVPFLRITNNIGKTSLINKFYRKTYNTILNLNKLAGTDYFGSTDNLKKYNNKIADDSIIELMIHPGQVLNKQVFDVYSKENLSLHLPSIIDGNNLISYNQLKKV